ACDDRRIGPADGAAPAHREPQARGVMIRLESLTKHYGRSVAVDGISLDVPRGILYGFLGPNGAGKTTTLRMIAGILRPTDAGAARWGRCAPESHRREDAARLHPRPSLRLRQTDRRRVSAVRGGTLRPGRRRRGAPHHGAARRLRARQVEGRAGRGLQSRDAPEA